ncbi:MAG: GNAT family N-acetyltransferase, partial [Euryarchaeota archaeon]|nr:GNAT family N-acetyltransferase [Euryarchaeota archaeon]
MVSIRPFKESDNEQILAMEKLCPQGDENYALITDKSLDASARYKLYDNYHFLVAEESGEIAGSIGWVVKKSNKGDLYIYLVEVNVHPNFRRQGIASQLINEVEKHAVDIGANYIYCYIYEPNKASKVLFTKYSYFNPIYFKSCVLPVYKTVKIPEKFVVKRIKKNEIHEVVDIINHYYEGREHFIPYTADSFESFVNGIPGYTLDNFWVVKEKGEIVACTGLWDTSRLVNYYYKKLPLSVKAISAIFKFLNKLTKMPKIMSEGEYFKLNFMVDPAFKS